MNADIRLGRFAPVRSLLSMSRKRSAARRRGGRGSRLLLVPAACLAGLLIYVLLPGAGGPAALASCTAGAPAVLRVAPQRLGGLREAVARVLPDRLGRLYEEGAVTGATAWSDDEPLPPAVSVTARRPAGYEMRWWAPDGDDVVADVYEFANGKAAQRFLDLAGSGRCRRRAREQPSERPAQARNVSWVNPDGASEVDLYMARGPRVYRVADAPAVSPGRGPQLARALYTIDLLACLLPEAGCRSESAGVPS